MKRDGKLMKIGCSLVVCTLLALGGGCATKGQTGAATGAGAGALIGGLANMHGSWGATALLGAGIGAGVGYLIGNEEDKKDAAKREAVREGETKPLAGTTWQVISIVPKPEKSYKSIVSHFKSNGTVVTTKTNLDGRVEKTTERYRIVGSTLILSNPDYIVNANFKIEKDKLIIDYGNGSTVLQRVS